MNLAGLMGANAAAAGRIIFPAITAPSSPIPSSGLQLWLRADSGVTYDGGNNVSVWSDQSGSGNNATYVSGNRASYVASGINNKPTISFPGNGSWLQVSQNTIGNTGNLAVFVVINRTSGGIILNKGDGATFGGTVWELTPQNGYGFTSNNSSWRTVPVSFTGLNLITATTQNGVSRIAYNGIDSGNTSAQATVINAISQYIGIGGGGTNGGSQANLNASISEILVYDRDLTSQERQQVEAYLNAKYAIY